MSGLSINTAPSAGGDFRPYVNYDARAGRVIRPDRYVNSTGQWETEKVDITKDFSAVFDLANLQEGWINFPTGGAPDMRMVPLGTPGGVGPAPSPNHKQGVRMLVKLSAQCGGDVRVFSSSAKVVTGAVGLLLKDYEEGVAGNPGMLPVVAIASTLPVTSGSGSKKSTNYAPDFKIERWVNRPADLVEAANDNVKATAPQGNVTPVRSPPSTGSTKVSAPAAKKNGTTGAEDFG